jgi:hypothetical protein
MCGIVGAIATRNVVPILLEGLKRLEYRGYDSAGLAVINDAALHRLRSTGRVAELKLARLMKRASPVARHRAHALGHPRRARANATPIRMSPAASPWCTTASSRTMKRCVPGCKAKVTNSSSDTDTEVIAHLVHIQRLKGGAIFRCRPARAPPNWSAPTPSPWCREADPSHLVVARHGAPLLLGLGDGENFAASDTSALVQVTQARDLPRGRRRVPSSRAGVTALSMPGHQSIGRRACVEPVGRAVELGNYRHYMQKEIFEQPMAVANTLEMVTNAGAASCRSCSALTSEPSSATQMRQVLILACGTSFHAGMVARYWLEGFAGIACSVEIASEYRYRDSVPEPEGAGHHHFAVRRNRRHAGRAAARQVARPPYCLSHLQRAGVGAGARDRTCASSPAPVRKSALPRPRPSPPSSPRWLSADAGAGQDARPPDAEREAIELLQCPAPPADGLSTCWRLEPQIEVGGVVCDAPPRAVPRPRRALSDRHGRRAEAEGNLLHPCRGLCRPVN